MARSTSDFRKTIAALSSRFVAVEQGNATLKIKDWDPVFVRNFNAAFSKYKDWWRGVQEKMKKRVVQSEWESLNDSLDLWLAEFEGWEKAFKNRKDNPEKYKASPTPERPSPQAATPTPSARPAKRRASSDFVGPPLPPAGGKKNWLPWAAGAAAAGGLLLLLGKR